MSVNLEFRINPNLKVVVSNSRASVIEKGKPVFKCEKVLVPGHVNPADVPKLIKEIMDEYNKTLVKKEIVDADYIEADGA